MREDLKKSLHQHRYREQTARNEERLMKILITSDWYSPAVNGVVTSVKNLRRELERRGHEVRVLTLSQSRRS